MRLRYYTFAAALVAAGRAAAVDDAWRDALRNSIKNQVTQVQNQVASSINQELPGILSRSAENAINQQLQPFTANQPQATPQAPAQPAAPVQQQPQQPAVTQAPAGNQAPAAQPAANNQPATSQAPAAAGGGERGSSSGGQAANNVAGGDTVVDVVVIDGTTLNAADVTVSTLTGGNVVTIAGVSTLLTRPSPGSASDLTDAQGRTLTGSIQTLSGGNASRPVGVKTATVGDSDLSGNMTVHTTTGLSKPASIGLGVGLGGFTAALVGGFFFFRWWARRKQARKHKRAPSIVISSPLEARQDVTHDAKLADDATKDMRELDGVGKPGVPGTLDTPATSIRSPVSPWTPATSTTGTTHSPTQVPNIYEMMGSQPVEMSAAPAGAEMAAGPAGAEMAGSETAQELNSAVDSSEPAAKERPFSYTQTPVDAFLSEKKLDTKNDSADANQHDNRI